MPLLGTDRVLGAIAVASTDQEHLLGASDERLLLNIAAQAGVAVENAQLYGQAQERAFQLTTLNSISTLLTGSLSPEKVINLVASSVVAVANCDAVAVYLNFDDRLTLVRNIGLSEEFSRQAPPPLIVTPEVMNSPERAVHQPVVVNDIFSDPLVDDVRREIMEREVKHAWVEIMLLSGEQPLGVIAAYYDLPRAFTNDEVELLRNFAVQAALAVNNARLYATTDSALNQRVDQLQALYDIGQELSSTLNLQKLFDLVVHRAQEGTRSQSGMVVVGAEDGLSLQVAAGRGYPPGVADPGHTISTGITAAVYDTGHPLLMSDVREQRDYAPLNPATRSQLSVPIHREAETLGVLTVESPFVNAFGDDDLTFVTQLATHASIAVENARLFKRIAEGRDRMQAILDSMNEGVLLIDRDGKVSLANPHIETLIGIDPVDVVDRLVDDLLVMGMGASLATRLGFTPSELRLLLADLRAGDLSEEILTQHAYELDEPAHIFLSRQVAPVRDEHGTLLGLLVVVLDQTDQEELARARDDPNRTIVDDLRGPLTAITASLKLLNDLLSAYGEITSIVHSTTEASQRAVKKPRRPGRLAAGHRQEESGQFNAGARADPLECRHRQRGPGYGLPGPRIGRHPGGGRALLPAAARPGRRADRARAAQPGGTTPSKFTPAYGNVTIAAFSPGQQGAAEGFVRVQVERYRPLASPTTTRNASSTASSRWSTCAAAGAGRAWA